VFEEKHVRFQVLMTVSIKETVFWDVPLCNLVECPDDEGSKYL
jgi:hypothetical protein